MLVFKALYFCWKNHLCLCLMFWKHFKRILCRDFWLDEIWEKYAEEIGQVDYVVVKYEGHWGIFLWGNTPTSSCHISSVCACTKIPQYHLVITGASDGIGKAFANKVVFIKSIITNILVYSLSWKSCIIVYVIFAIVYLL
jgi:phage shock protein PspC (stress-responsive transcriptional regulator)